MRYAIVIETSATGFAAYVPDLPGCVATGRTRDDVLVNIRAAVEFHLDGLREDGSPRPVPTSTCEYVEPQR